MSTEVSTMVKKKYSDLLSLGKEALDAVQKPFKVLKAKKDLEKEIISVEQAIAEQDLKISEAKGAHPINLRNILDCIDKKDLLERDLKLAKELQEELF